MPHLRCHHENPATLPAQSVRHLRGEASDESGRVLQFFNPSLGGGFIAYYADSYQTETHPGHICFIDDIRCYADEARFGGIVIEPLTDQPE